MTRQQIIDIQTKIGTTPDGFWGPKSIKACKDHLRSLMPEPNPWPKSDLASMKAFYGEPGNESNLVNLPAPVPMTYDGTPIRTIRCHKKVAESLSRALKAAYAVAPAFVSNYDGCYNYRVMRGGSSFSKHAWGVAIDLSAETNGNFTHWPTKANMPFEVMECFAREGWTSAGAFWGRDAMHMEAAST